MYQGLFVGPGPIDTTERRRPRSGWHWAADSGSRKRITAVHATQWPLHDGLRVGRGVRHLVQRYRTLRPAGKPSLANINHK